MMGRVLLPTPSQATSRGKQPPVLSLGSCVCVCVLQRAPGCLPHQAAHASLPLEHTEGDPEPWHVAVLGSVLAPGWDVPQVRVPELWLFLAGRGEEQHSLSLCLGRGWVLGGVWGLGEHCEQEISSVQLCVLDGQPWVCGTSLCSWFWQGCCSKPWPLISQQPIQLGVYF